MGSGFWVTGNAGYWLVKGPAKCSGCESTILSLLMPACGRKGQVSGSSLLQTFAELAAPDSGYHCTGDQAIPTLRARGLAGDY